MVMVGSIIIMDIIIRIIITRVEGIIGIMDEEGGIMVGIIEGW